MDHNYKKTCKSKSQIMKYKRILLCLLGVTSVAFAGTRTTMYTVDGSSIKPLDISAGDGVIANSTMAPTFMESGVVAVISAAKEKKYMYMLNANTNKVSVYWKDTGGVLTKKSEFDIGTGGTHPIAMAISQNQGYAYVVNRDSNNVSMFSINQDTGALTSIASPVTTGSGPIAFVFSPDGTRAFVANNKSNDLTQYTIDQGSGILSKVNSTVVGTAPVSLKAIKNKTGSQFVYALNDGGNNGGSISIFAIPEAGSTLVKTQPATIATNGKHPSAMSILSRDESRHFMYVNNNSDVSKDAVAVYEITDSGVPTLVQSMVSTYTSPTHAASTKNMATLSSLDPRKGFLYASNPYNGTVAAYKIESATNKLNSSPASVSAQATNDTGTIVMGQDDIDETAESLEITPHTSTVTTTGLGPAFYIETPTLFKNMDPYPFQIEGYTVHKYNDDAVPEWDIHASHSEYDPNNGEIPSDNQSECHYISNSISDIEASNEKDYKYRLLNKDDSCKVYVYVESLLDGSDAGFYITMHGHYIYESGNISDDVTYTSPNVSTVYKPPVDETDIGHK